MRLQNTHFVKYIHKIIETLIKELHHSRRNCTSFVCHILHIYVILCTFSQNNQYIVKSSEMQQI